MSPSDNPVNTAGSCQSFIFKLIDSTRSPLPFPLSPWHIAQSYPKTFFAAASTSGEDFTGFSFFTGAGAGEAAGVVAGGVVVAATGVSAGFSCAFSCTLQTPTAIATLMPSTCKRLLISTSQENARRASFRPTSHQTTMSGISRDAVYTYEARMAQKRLLECSAGSLAAATFVAATFGWPSCVVKLHSAIRSAMLRCNQSDPLTA